MTFQTFATITLALVLTGHIFQNIEEKYSKTSSKPRTEYIPLCWNQTIPDVPVWHPAARCTGMINRMNGGYHDD